MMNKTIKPASVFVLLSLMLLSACATTPSPDEIVKERAEARWEALLSRDYASAYSFYSPGYRSTTSATDFEIEFRLRRVRWTMAEYMDHDCEENTCSVSFRMGYRVGSPVPGVNSWDGYDKVTDQWVKTSGEWWYLPEE